MFPEVIVFGIKFPAYGLVSFFGFTVTALVGLWLIGKRSITRKDFFSVSVAVLFGVVAGANLLYAITRAGEIREFLGASESYNSVKELLEGLCDLCSGMVFYGGLYGGLLAGFLLAKRKKIPLKNISDTFAVLIPLFHTFGRIGCFLAGCCYGVESRWGISGRVITGDVKESAKRIPVQLIESGLLFCLFVLMLCLFFRKVSEGRLILIYLLIYPVLRFVLEFFRGDEVRGHFLMFSTSQWISIMTLLWVSFYLVISKAKKQKC